MQYLQYNNIPSTALTNYFVGALGKIKSCADLRISELINLGIRFNYGFCEFEQIELKTLPKVDDCYPLYKQGILFCL